TALLDGAIDAIEQVIAIDTVVGSIPKDGNFTMTIDDEPVVVTSAIESTGTPGLWFINCIRGKPGRSDIFKGVPHANNATCLLKRTQKYGIDLFDDKTQVNHYTIT